MLHEPRPSRPWLIFDVGQKMMASEAEYRPERKVLALNERELTLVREHTFAPRELLALPIKVGCTYKLYLTKEDANELLGYIAAESNHAKEKKLGAAFDALYEKVGTFERSFVE